MAEGAMDIQENFVQCWYTSLPIGLWWIECAKTTAEIIRSPGLGWCKRSHCSIIEGKIEPFTTTQLI